jgi:hypothetical protein
MLEEHFCSSPDYQTSFSGKISTCYRVCVFFSFRSRIGLSGKKLQDYPGHWAVKNAPREGSLGDLAKRKVNDESWLPLPIR